MNNKNLIQRIAVLLVVALVCVVTGREYLHSADVAAHDLRAGAALIIAGLAAKGTSTIRNIHFVERGYENIVEKFTAMGANIRRIED